MAWGLGHSDNSVVLATCRREKYLGFHYFRTFCCEATADMEQRKHPRVSYKTRNHLEPFMQSTSITGMLGYTTTKMTQQPCINLEPQTGPTDRNSDQFRRRLHGLPCWHRVAQSLNPKPTPTPPRLLKYPPPPPNDNNDRYCINEVIAIPDYKQE